MQIVIDIEDSTYNDLRYAKQYNPRFLSNYEKIILSGTPLPEHHRRLLILDGDLVDDYLVELGNWSSQKWISEFDLSNAIVAIVPAQM